MNPLVSIVIPTYKREPEMMERAIKSVINQTYNNWELIIVDDNGYDSKYCSKNEVFMKKYVDNNKIIYIKHEFNKGANAARNTGIKISKGSFVAFLDSDDEWKINKLERFIEAYNNSNKECGVVFSSYFVVTENGIERDTQIKSGGKLFYKEIYGDNVSPTSAVMVKKECFNKAGYFDENLPARQDYDMWLSISRFYEFTFIDEELVYIYRNGHEAISSNYKKHIEGTKMVLNKIYSYLSNEELYKYKKSIDNSQYNYIALVCMRNEDYKLAKNYIIKAIKSKKNYESILIMLCSYVPIIFKMLRNIKRSRLANLRRNKEKFKRCI